jgi:guanylate kinase
MTPKLIIFAGPSGAGKSTIVKHLLAQNNNLSFSISATTRNPRTGEKNNEDYYFLTEQDFRNKLASNEFIEHEEVYSGTLYGTLKSEINRIGDLGKNVIFDIDVVGALSIKKLYGDKALSILVMPPSIEILKQRLEARGTETPESIAKRVGKAEEELSYVNHFDKHLINIELEDSIAIAQQLVRDFLK